MNTDLRTGHEAIILYARLMERCEYFGSADEIEMEVFVGYIRRKVLLEIDGMR